MLEKSECFLPKTKNKTKCYSHKFHPILFQKSSTRKIFGQKKEKKEGRKERKERNRRKGEREREKGAGWKDKSAYSHERWIICRKS